MFQRIAPSDIQDAMMSPERKTAATAPDVCQRFRTPEGLYVDDIMQHLKSTEASRTALATYMTKQPDINPKMRSVAILIQIDFERQ